MKLTEENRKFFEVFSHLVLLPTPIFWELAILWARKWWQNQLLYPLHMFTGKNFQIYATFSGIGIGKGVGSGGHTQPSYWLLVCQHRLGRSTKRMNHHINIIICVYCTWILCMGTTDFEGGFNACHNTCMWTALLTVSAQTSMNVYLIVINWPIVAVLRNLAIVQSLYKRFQQASPLA